MPRTDRPSAPALTHPNTARAWALTDDAFPLAMLLVALAAGAFMIPAQNDTWWHLHSGRAMVETGSFLTVERFSFASQGQPLDNHWWLTQLLFFGLYSLGGPLLLTVGAGLCAFGAVYGALRLVRASVEVRLILLVALILCTAPEWSIRPQVVSLLMLVLMAHLIVANRLWWLPVVCLVWGNAHAMVVFGVLMAGALVADSVLFSRERLRASLAILGLCLVAPMVSPLGWHYWPRVLATVSTSQTLEIQEYRTPLALDDLPFWIVLATLVALLVRHRRSLPGLARGSRVLLIASVALALAAISAARNVAFFSVIAVPAISTLLPFTPRRRQARAAAWPAYALLGAEVVAAVVFVTLRWADGGSALGWRPFEPAALQAVRTCPGPLFNTLEDGGPLMWALRDRPIFVDSRMEAYPQALLAQSREADLNGRYEAVFRQFGITCAIVNTGSTLDERLRNDQTMAVAYQDPSRTVFVKRITGQ